MRIRTQLLLAFLLLSVLPLTAIVVYSYQGSTAALRRASQEEGARLTRDMNTRLASVREELDTAVARAKDLPAPMLIRVFEEDPAATRALAVQLGKAAPYLESFAFVPQASAAKAAPGSPAPETPAAPGIASATVPPLPPVEIDIESVLASVRAADMPESEKKRVEQEVAAAIQATRSAAALESAARAFENRTEETLKGQAEIAAKAGQKIEDSPSPTVLAAGAENEPAGDLGSEPHQPPAASLPVPSVPAVPGVAPITEPGSVESERLRAEREREQVQHEAARINQHRDHIAQEHARAVLGRDFRVPVMEKGEVVGTIDMKVSGDQVVGSILASAQRSQGEIPFTIDRDGKLYAINADDKRRLQPIRASLARAGSQETRVEDDWVIASSRDPESGLVYGIARPLGEPLRDLRQSAARNFTFGLGLIGIALIGMVPVANHITRDLEAVRSGAERIAAGDLQTRLPVRSKNEIGRLASAFNSMAADLEVHQREETHRHLMEAEYARKSQELEEARRFQLSLLPKSVPHAPPFEVAVVMRTATEVGGDYYDFRVGADGSLSAAIGDATGHGARAATMVTILKSLFAAAEAAGEDPAAFLAQASTAVRRMELERMTMAFALAQFRGTATGATMTLASAAMPPALVFRVRSGSVEEIAMQGLPLGTMSMQYEQRSVTLQRGDVVLLMTDGLAELIGTNGEPFGYTAVETTFASIGTLAPQEMVDRLAAAAADWTGGQPPGDDITFVAIRIT